MGNMCKAFEDYRQEGVEEGIRLQMKETNKAKRAAERAKEKNIELKKEMRRIKNTLNKENDLLLKRIKELESRILKAENE